VTSAAPSLPTTSLVIREGEVERVVFENAETSFRVLRVRLDGSKKGDESEAWVGSFRAAAQGMRVKASGVYENDPKRGPQFKVATLETLVPTSIDGITAYLASGLIHGIGPDLAKRIVQVFGSETLKVMDTDPNALKRVKGIGEKKVASIAVAWQEQRVVAEVMAFLSQHGASPGLAHKILTEYGNDKAMQIVRENPYRLAVDIDGVGFKTADRIALASGLPADSAARAQAAVLHAMGEHFTSKGHVFATARALVDATAEMLERDPSAVAEAVVELHRAGKVIVERMGGELGDVVYPRGLHRAEVKLAEGLRRLLDAPAGRPAKVPGGANVDMPGCAELAIGIFEAKAKVTLADAQRDAVMLAAKSKVMVMTGGPGVGKTATTKAILTTFEIARLDVLCAAPTGRAAKRMHEATGHAATTIHRLLEYNPKMGGYQRNAQCPLNCDVVVVDEASMIDLLLAEALVQAIPSHARLIVIGDVDQLPSVGPGAVLRDIIDCGLVPTVRLTQVFRQAAGSLISLNAQRINAGEMPESAEGPAGEFYVVEREDPASTADTILEMVTKRIPARFGYKPMEDMLVLTPMHKGETGTIAMNQRLQAALNPPTEGKAELQRGGFVLRVGDKVAQKKNDRDREVYNGDVGIVKEIDAEARRVVVRFDDRDVACEGPKQLEQLQLAYASTIHRVQGSEAPVVVMTMLTAHYMMLQRSLLYVGTTRGKRLVVLVTNKRAMKLALAEARREDRSTLLAQRLRGEVRTDPLA
jgi:exodeoxyribonuclease V alpha subunit